MEEKITRLYDSELDIMLIVWDAGQPISSTYILERLKGKRRWALATLMTVLSRLCAKGYLACEKQGRYNLYHAVLAEDKYKAFEGKSVLEKLYGNSFQKLVASLYNGKAINEDDLSGLQEFLDNLKKEG